MVIERCSDCVVLRLQLLKDLDYVVKRYKKIKLKKIEYTTYISTKFDDVRCVSMFYSAGSVLYTGCAWMNEMIYKEISKKTKTI